jgi:hypothetical protein
MFIKMVSHNYVTLITQIKCTTFHVTLSEKETFEV